MSKRLNLVGPAFEQPEYSLLAREKVLEWPAALCPDLLSLQQTVGCHVCCRLAPAVLAELALAWAALADALLDPCLTTCI